VRVIVRVDVILAIALLLAAPARVETVSIDTPATNANVAGVAFWGTEHPA
jgi:ethanolamine utilization microcompartment shell protein EutL